VGDRRVEIAKLRREGEKDSASAVVIVAPALDAVRHLNKPVTALLFGAAELRAFEGFFPLSST
jgi:hypothetical protein